MSRGLRYSDNPCESPVATPNSQMVQILLGKFCEQGLNWLLTSCWVSETVTVTVTGSVRGIERAREREFCARDRASEGESESFVRNHSPGGLETESERGRGVVSGDREREREGREWERERERESEK
jgi:hypothetical protein